MGLKKEVEKAGEKAKNIAKRIEIELEQASDKIDSFVETGIEIAKDLYQKTKDEYKEYTAKKNTAEEHQTDEEVNKSLETVSVLPVKDPEIKLGGEFDAQIGHESQKPNDGLEIKLGGELDVQMGFRSQKFEYVPSTGIGLYTARSSESPTEAKQKILLDGEIDAQMSHESQKSEYDHKVAELCSGELTEKHAELCSYIMGDGSYETTQDA